MIKFIRNTFKYNRYYKIMLFYFNLFYFLRLFYRFCEHPKSYQKQFVNKEWIALLFIFLGCKKPWARNICVCFLLRTPRFIKHEISKFFRVCQALSTRTHRTCLHCWSSWRDDREFQRPHHRLCTMGTLRVKFS